MKLCVITAWVWIFVVANVFSFSYQSAVCVSLEKNVCMICPFQSWVMYPFMVDLQELFIHSGY